MYNWNNTLFIYQFHVVDQYWGVSMALQERFYLINILFIQTYHCFVDE